MAVEMGFELRDTAETVFGDQSREGQEIDVPAAVLIDGQQDVMGLGKGDQGAGFGGGRGEWLLDDDVFARFDGGGAQGKVGGGWGGDDDEGDGEVGEDGIKGAVNFYGGMSGRWVVFLVGGALENGMEIEGLGIGEEKGDVEDFGGEAIADHRDMVWLG